MPPLGRGKSSAAGFTLLGSANVLTALRSDPVRVSNRKVRVGALSRNTIVASRGRARSRLSSNMQYCPVVLSKVTALSMAGMPSMAADSTKASSACPRAPHRVHSDPHYERRTGDGTATGR